jgi:hypothetical protein
VSRSGGGSVVLVDEAAEAVVATNLPDGRCRCRRWLSKCRWLELEGAVRPGCQYVVSSCCGEVVGVQEAAESVASLELLDGGEWGWWRRWLGRDGWAAAERSVRALGVVVVDVDAQDAVELARAED